MNIHFRVYSQYVVLIPVVDVSVTVMFVVIFVLDDPFAIAPATISRYAHIMINKNDLNWNFVLRFSTPSPLAGFSTPLPLVSGGFSTAPWRGGA